MRTFAPTGFENPYGLTLFAGLRQKAAGKCDGRDQSEAQLGGILGQFTCCARIPILERQGAGSEEDGALSPKSVGVDQPALAITFQDCERTRPIAVTAAEFEHGLPGPCKRGRSLCCFLGILACGGGVIAALRLDE